MRRGTAVTACLLDCSKAFDKCKFEVLFDKLVEKGLTAVVIRALIFIYEEQTGCVKLAGKASSEFRLTHGLLSPVLLSILYRWTTG